MPTIKPRIQTILEQTTYDKFKKICEKEERTESNLAKRIITKYVEQYEEENGEIKIEQ